MAGHRAHGAGAHRAGVRAVNQLALFNRKETIQERFERFHAENPHVYQRLRDLVLDDLRSGIPIAGIDFYVSVLRWKVRMETRGDDFKLNNDWRSRYARMLMGNEPQLRGKFEIRTLKSA